MRRASRGSPAGTAPGPSPRRRPVFAAGIVQLAEAPLCFVLDDLQWADEESITLLSEVLVGGPGRIMVVGLLRPDGIDAAHPLDRLLRRIHGSDAAVSLPLATLGATDARHLVEAVTEGRIDPGMSNALAAQAEGNPFLLMRLCAHLSRVAPGEQQPGSAHRPRRAHALLFDSHVLVVAMVVATSDGKGPQHRSAHARSCVTVRCRSAR